MCLNIFAILQTISVFCTEKFDCKTSCNKKFIVFTLHKPWIWLFSQFKAKLLVCYFIISYLIISTNATSNTVDILFINDRNNLKHQLLPDTYFEHFFPKHVRRHYFQHKLLRYYWDKMTLQLLMSFIQLHSWLFVNMCHLWQQYIRRQAVQIMVLWS